jgi:hypothetical protein
MTDARRVSAAIDRHRFPHLASFVEWGIDMQLEDVRDLLLLPLPDAGLHSGHNFSAAAALVNFIGGASVWFYDASEKGLRDRRDRTRRYRETLYKYWPWHDGELVSPLEGFNVLYTYTRNPLAHGFGLSDPADGMMIKYAKSPWSDTQVAELDAAERRPSWLGPTLGPGGAGAAGHAYCLAVPALYWGVRRLLHAVLTDEEHAPSADALAQTLLRFLTTPNAAWR